MNILFLGYWEFHDGLTTATILPHLNILASLDTIDKLIFCSIERSKTVFSGNELKIEKAYHIPLYTKDFPLNIINKILDFLIFPNQLEKICKENNIVHIIARGSPAGALAYLLHRSLSIPFSVESFEPHSEYMYQNGIWKWYDPRFLFQKHWEKKIKQYAKDILPLSNAYIEKLKSEGIDKRKLYFMPCSVDVSKYTFNPEERSSIRIRHNLKEDDLVGIYVGKFGGLYYDCESFKIIKKAFDFFGRRHFMVILTPQDKEEILDKMKKQSIPTERCLVTKVGSDQVPQFLSMADYAYCFHRSSPYSIAFSPIKNGEYFAAGLPVIISKNIGDDSNWIVEYNIGALFSDEGELDECFSKVELLLGDKFHKKRIINFAEKFKSYKIQENVYSQLFGHS